MSVNFSHAVFCLLSIHKNLVMQALVWLHMVELRLIQSGAVRFGASQAI